MSISCRAFTFQNYTNPALKSVRGFSASLIIKDKETNNYCVVVDDALL